MDMEFGACLSWGYVYVVGDKALGFCMCILMRDGRVGYIIIYVILVIR